MPCSGLRRGGTRRRLRQRLPSDGQPAVGRWNDRDNYQPKQCYCRRHTRRCTRHDLNLLRLSHLESAAADAGSGPLQAAAGAADPRQTCALEPARSLGFALPKARIRLFCFFVFFHSALCCRKQGIDQGFFHFAAASGTTPSCTHWTRPGRPTSAPTSTLPACGADILSVFQLCSCYPISVFHLYSTCIPVKSLHCHLVIIEHLVLLCRPQRRGVHFPGLQCSVLIFELPRQQPLHPLQPLCMLRLPLLLHHNMLVLCHQANRAFCSCLSI